MCDTVARVYTGPYERSYVQGGARRAGDSLTARCENFKISGTRRLDYFPGG